MNKEDIDYLISIQSLPDEEFQIAYLERELDKKENIIKEAREYIKEQLCQGGERETRDLVDGYELLEILDKVSDEK